MKKNYALLFLATLFFGFGGLAQDLRITGVIDGPLSGGLPKAVELYAVNDIADLSFYSLGSANNGGGTDGEEFVFPVTSVTAGSFIYIASEEVQFASFFGFTPDYVDSTANINGDDAIELFYQGTVIDTFGDINTDGTGQPWEYLDGWAYRKSDTGPDGATFVLDNWTYSGLNALDGQTSNANAPVPFPTATFGGGQVDIIANPTNFNSLDFSTTAIDLTWALNPNNDNILLAFSTTAPLTASPEEGIPYVPGEQLSDGSTILLSGNNSSFNHAGLIPNTSYYYKIWSVSDSFEYSTGVTTTAKTQSDSPISANLIITGVFDGPLSGGVPKGVELYATAAIDDLSTYGLGSANNGGGTDGQEFTFDAVSVAAGTFIYVASETDGFTSFFGFEPDYTTGAMGINGDDAVELFLNGNVIDVFGDINTDGTGTAWDHVDGWAYRKDNSIANGGSFDPSNWIFSGTDALDGSTDNATATAPFPTKAFGPDLLITGVIDGPLSGGTPKAMELYVRNTIADLSSYGVGSANNGGGTDGVEFTFPAVSVAAGTYIYVASETDNFTTYLGFAPDYTSGALAINGDDAVELFYNNEIIDVFGDSNTDGTGQAWEYLDGWAYRNTGTLNNGSFVLTDWSFSGTNALDGTTTNATASLPYPVKTYAGGDGGVDENPDVISISEARNATEGTLVTVTGVLTVADEFGGSAYLQDTTAGIAIFDPQVHGEGLFQVGDSITVTAVRRSFNEQLQLGPVTSVSANGTSNQPIIPATITLDQLGAYDGQLVKINNVSFPRPNDLLFGNSNYQLTDASGTGEMRIDNDVTELVGLAQPENCGEVIGVVGKFRDFYQLLPRQRTDLACAQPYENPPLPIPVDPASTLEITTWNIEWFGDDSNSPAAGNPNSDTIQKDSVKTIIQQLNPDVLAVQEIADEALFTTMVNELEGYSYVLSPAVSYPDDTSGNQQKVGFIYKTSTVSITDTKVLLESVHPYYNGGDTSFLTDYPSTPDRFYASGRLPFMMSTQVTIDSTQVPYDFIVLHARANSSNGPQERYDMRKYDVEMLRDSLNQYYPTNNLVLLGDFNDDVDETVADDINTTLSSYEAYVADATNFDVLTDVLSEQGFRSYAFRENMIDHILVSNEVAPNYIDQSARVHYEFYDGDYTSTASDHFPVSVRMLIKPLSLEQLASTDISCFGNADGTASVSISGGAAPYTYAWSNGANTPSVSGLEAGDYTVTITDALSASVSASLTLMEPAALDVITSEDVKVFIGYNDANCTTLSILETMGGTAPYNYLWNTGETTEQIHVCPEETTTYSVTVTDANGCETIKDITVTVEDVSCGNNYRNPKVTVCFKGRSLCVSKRAAARLLEKGATLGSCENVPPVAQVITASPNPFNSYTEINFSTPTQERYYAVVFNSYGRVVYRTWIRKGCQSQKLYLNYLYKGIYFLNLYEGREVVKSIKLIKE